MSPEPGFPARDSRYAWFVVFLLSFVNAVAFIDRQLLNLLVDLVKQDLLLSDTQISLLQGTAFMAAYIVMGPVFGRWIDRGNRRNVLLLGVVLWSVFTTLCGFAPNYWALFGARAGVGAAEACLAPAIWSLISDYFSREQLPRAMSIQAVGSYVGGGLALVFGGMIVAYFATSPQLSAIALAPWQLTFIAVGVPGLAIAALLFFVREPPRTAPLAGASDATFSLPQAFAYFWQRRAFYVRFILGMALMVVIVYSVPAWMPAYLMRHFGVAPGIVGLQFGTLVLVAGPAGVLAGPVLSKWLAGRGYGDAPIRAAAIGAAALIPACAVLPFAPDYVSALAAGAVITLLYSFPQALAAAALQLATPNRLRGLVASLYVFVVSVLGLGVAPTLVALCTDYVLRDPARVGESLGIVCSAAALLGAWLIATAAAPYQRLLDQSNPAPRDPAATLLQTAQRAS